MMKSSLRSVVGAAVFHIGLLLSIPVWGVPSLATGLLPFRQRYWFITRWCGWILWWLWVCCGVRVRVEGLENIPPDGAVVAAKHQSAWETFALEQWFHPQSWVIKRQLLHLPFFGWCLKLLEPIAIDRGAGREAVKQIVTQGGDRLERGRYVVVFPEGTRVPAGYRGRYRIGGAILACETGFPIVPVAHNAGEIWPRRSFRIHPGTIHVRILPAVLSANREPDELMGAVAGAIEAAMPDVSQCGYSGEPRESERKGRA
jgi:1-acyl-sn-glycerol-3-phosphate acyltransferase